MASRQQAAMWAAEAARTEDISGDLAKARELMQQFDGWHVFSSRNNKVRLATRRGKQTGPDDGTWAATLLGDSWTDLERQLAEQAQHDAELTYVEVTQ